MWHVYVTSRLWVWVPSLIKTEVISPTSQACHMVNAHKVLAPCSWLSGQYRVHDCLCFRCRDQSSDLGSMQGGAGWHEVGDQWVSGRGNGDRRGVKDQEGGNRAWMRERTVSHRTVRSRWLKQGRTQRQCQQFETYWLEDGGRSAETVTSRKYIWLRGKVVSCVGNVELIIFNFTRNLHGEFQ